MASYHRMLFPGFGNGVDTCFECMIHSPFDSNNYLPPPPPPQSNDHNKNEIYAIITVAVSVFSAGFLLITFCILIIRYFSKQRSRSLGSQNIDHDEDHVEIHNSMNYVWYVRTMGLEDSVIKSIVEWKFKKGEGLIEGRECAVCLNEFQEGERLRLLPKCSHAFHIYCIDTWLKSHVNCPLCRAHIVSNIDNSSVSGLNQGSSSAIQETHMINATRTSSERNQTDNLNDNRSTIHPHWEESQFKDGPFYFESIQGDPTVHVGHEYRVFSDLVHDRRLDKRKIGPVNEIQSKRRSLSLDTFYASMINSSLNN